MPEIKATIVFSKLWAAIHAKNADGTRKYRYIILPGSSRSSKTRSLIQSHYLYGLQNNGKRISIWRYTKKDCRDTVGKDMEVVYPLMPHFDNVRFNRTESIYQFSNQSTIELCGTDEPNRVHGFNGHVIHLNEPYDMSKSTFDQLDMRTADYVTIDLNPKEGHWSDEIQKDPRCIVIHSTWRDNPFIPVEQKLKILSYQPVKLARVVLEKKISENEAFGYDLIKNPFNFNQVEIKELVRCLVNEKRGSADVFNHQVYSEGLHAERPNRILFWNEIPDHEYEAIQTVKYYGIDWGVVDPWGILEAKYYDGCLYFHELNYKSENAWRETMDIQTLIDINKVEEGLVKWRLQQLNLNKKAYYVCDNNRLLKIAAMIQVGYENAIPAMKPAGSILDGINILVGLKCFYTASSTNLKKEQQNYSRLVDKYGVPQEEPEDKHNHLIDPARYLAIFLSMMGIIKR